MAIAAGQELIQSNATDTKLEAMNFLVEGVLGIAAGVRRGAPEALRRWSRKPQLQYRRHAAEPGDAFMPLPPARTAEAVLVPSGAMVGVAAAVRGVRRLRRGQPALGLRLYGRGLGRVVVLAAEHVDPRGAADPDWAVHGATGAGRADDHRRRGRLRDRRPVRGDGRRRAARRAGDCGAVGDGRGGHRRRRLVDRIGRRTAPLARRQRDDFQPAVELHRDRHSEPARRRGRSAIRAASTSRPRRRSAMPT